MMPTDVSRMFNFSFEKTSTEIKDKAILKVAVISDKIKAREKRIVRLREEYGIDDKAYIDLLKAARQQQKSHDELASFTYSSNAPVGGGSTEPGNGKMEERTIGAGIVSAIFSESDHIEQDKLNLERLQAIVDNLRPLARYGTNTGSPYFVDSYQLSYAELEYLGF